MIPPGIAREQFRNSSLQPTANHATPKCGVLPQCAVTSLDALSADVPNYG